MFMMVLPVAQCYEVFYLSRPDLKCMSVYLQGYQPILIPILLHYSIKLVNERNRVFLCIHPIDQSVKFAQLWSQKNGPKIRFTLIVVTQAASVTLTPCFSQCGLRTTSGSWATPSGLRGNI